MSNFKTQNFKLHSVLANTTIYSLLLTMYLISKHDQLAFYYFSSIPLLFFQRACAHNCLDAGRECGPEKDYKNSALHCLVTYFWVQFGSIISLLSVFQKFSLSIVNVRLDTQIFDRFFLDVQNKSKLCYNIFLWPDTRNYEANILLKLQKL